MTGDGRMIEVSEQTGGPFLKPVVARGLSVGDIDADGDLDVLLTTNGGPAYLLRNEGPTGRVVELDLTGKGPNRDAIGAEGDCAGGRTGAGVYGAHGIFLFEPQSDEP